MRFSFIAHWLENAKAQCGKQMAHFTTMNLVWLVVQELLPKPNVV